MEILFKLTGITPMFTSSEEFSKTQSFFHSLPRWDFRFQRVTNSFDPEDWEYFQGLIMLAAPAVVVMLALFLIQLFTVIIGCCCCRNNVSYSIDQQEMERQKRGNRTFIARILVAFFSVLIIGAIVMGAISNNRVHTEIESSTDAVVMAEENIINNLNKIDADLFQIAQFFPDQADPIRKSLQEYSTVSVEVYTETKNVVDNYIQKYESIRASSFLIFFIVFASILFLSCGLSVVFAFKPCIACLLVFLIVFSPIFWLLFGSGTSGASLLADFCPVADQFIANITNDSGYSTSNWTNYYLDCQGFPPAQGAYDQLQNFTLEAESKLQWAKEHNASQEIIQGLEELVGWFLDINSSLVILNNCSVVSPVWKQVRNSFCDPIFNDICFLLVACGIVGILSTFVVIFSTRIYSAFRKPLTEDQLANYYFPLSTSNGQIQSNPPIGTNNNLGNETEIHPQSFYNNQNQTNQYEFYR